VDELMGVIDGNHASSEVTVTAAAIVSVPVYEKLMCEHARTLA
jgi:hypothetical protein